MEDELPERAHHGHGIDARVVVEAPILGGEEGARQALPDVFEADPAGPRAVVRGELAEQHAVAIAEDRARGGRAPLRQLGGQRHEERGDHHGDHGRRQDQRRGEQDAAGAAGAD